MKTVKIIINEAGEIAVEENKDGLTAYKRISPDDLINSISGSIRRDGVFSGLLPDGCLSYSRLEDGTISVTVLFHDRYADIGYYHTIYPHFPLPRLVFGFAVNPEYRVYRCSIGVIDVDTRLKPDTKMFRYPFSNVSGFNLCTGNNALPKCKNPHTLGSLPYLIMAMPNNDDHFRQANNKQGFNMRELLEHLKDKEPGYYYTDVLLPFEGVTLQDFIGNRAVY
jgi:hypothetical protein